MMQIMGSQTKNYHYTHIWTSVAGMRDWAARASLVWRGTKAGPRHRPFQPR